MRHRFIPPLAAFSLLCMPGLTACTSNRDTETARSATEEMLLSTAADRAAVEIAAGLPTGRKIFVDTSDFDAVDSKYAIGAIEDALLRRGNSLVTDRKSSDVVVMLRSGALATDANETLVGLPSFTAPIPLAGSATTPKIALYDKEDHRGVAKFAATAIDPKTGALIASTTPRYGYAHSKEYTVLLFISWDRQDYIPKKDEDTGE